MDLGLVQNILRIFYLLFYSTPKFGGVMKNIIIAINPLKDKGNKILDLVIEKVRESIYRF